MQIHKHTLVASHLRVEEKKQVLINTATLQLVWKNQIQLK